MERDFLGTLKSQDVTQEGGPSLVLLCRPASAGQQLTITLHPVAGIRLLPCPELLGAVLCLSSTLSLVGSGTYSSPVLLFLTVVNVQVG